MFLVLIQLFILLATAAGWGFWIWRATGAGNQPGWRHGWFYFGTAGFGACVLFLHALVYLNLPIRSTGWAGLLVALAGIGGGLLTWVRAGRPRVGRRGGRELMAAAGLFVLVWGSQAGALLASGPENYYGNAHTDQVNYVLLGEFLVEKPLTTSLAEVGLQPWMAKPILLKSFRIGQSVANGYLAVASGTDAKAAYGSLTIFVLGLGALAVFVLARQLAVPRWLALVTGLWWGVLPAVTKLQLDGFLSQTCVLFVFPTMAALFHRWRGDTVRMAPLQAIYLGYLLCTYTEVFVLGVGLLVSLTFLVGRQPAGWVARGAVLAAVVAGALVLNSTYARLFLGYAAQQYQIASSPLVLADLTPLSGTWAGWKQVFFGYHPFANPALERISLLVGLGIVFLVACAFQGRSVAKNRFQLAMVAPPLGVLALLLSAPVLPKYAFSKLLDTFTPFWLVLVVLGLLHLGRLFPTRVRWARGLAWGVVTPLAAASVAGSWPQWRAVVGDEGILSVVDSAGARRSYEAARNDPSATYLIEEPHPILNAWLAYAARGARAYLDADLLADLPVPATQFEFRHVPPLVGNFTVLDVHGPRRLDGYQGDPEISVHNPQGVDSEGEMRWYWIGPDATLEVLGRGEPGDPPGRYMLEFDALAGPANPDPARGLGLRDPDGGMQRFDFVNQATVRFEVTVRPGKNLFTLQVTHPTEQTFKPPTDPRDHMVRVQRFTLVRVPPAEQR